MLRFPNPGSTIQNFVAVFRAAIERYCGQVVTLDDFVRATVDANLATSSGHMGEAAISRSTRPDRSRDPLYNQLKMYAELFRSLGWLRSTEDAALNYTFTLLGEQMALAGRYWRPLLAENVLGIAYPSHVLRKLGDQEIRPFATILCTMLECNDGLSRDEIIVGPLSTPSDRNRGDIEVLADKIMNSRVEPKAIREALRDLSDHRGIQINTLRNYTRWPLAIMRDLEWTAKDRECYQGSTKSFEIHRLTPLGRELAKEIECSVDLRSDQVDSLPFEQRRALAQKSHFAMMDRTGFDVSPVADRLRDDEQTFLDALSSLGVSSDDRLLFSPFQSLSVSDSTAIFQGSVQAADRRTSMAASVREEVGRGSQAHIHVVPSFVHSRAIAEQTNVSELATELRSLLDTNESPCEAAQAFVDKHRADSKDEFYPLVTCLFELLGFRSEYSRPGVNYQRWDACVWLEGMAVPIEIKSPAEEQFLSTKAVRQALENKVIFLARGAFDTERSMTSLIVGYQMPNERGDMAMLIGDIYTAFGLNIGVLDLRTLGLMAIRAITELVSIDEAQLAHLKGFLDVRPTQT